MSISHVIEIESAACDEAPTGSYQKSCRHRGDLSARLAPSHPSGFRAVIGAEGLGIDSTRVENTGELFMKARFALCVSTVRCGSVSHPILCRSDCPSSVRACFESCHVHGCATLMDSRENMYYGLTKYQWGATARSSLSV